MSQADSVNRLVGFDLTVPMDKPAPGSPGMIFGVTEMVTFLNEWSSKWAFQCEQGANSADPDGLGGYKHFQVRLHLIKKDREGSLVAKTLNKDQAGFLPPGSHWSITSKTVHAAKKFNYVLKADSRMPGDKEIVGLYARST
jgi:hypothetical protein